MGWVDRVTALSGLVGVGLAGAGLSLADPSNVGDANPTSTADEVAQVFAANATSARAGAWCGVAAAFFLLVFFGRLHGALRAAAPGSWFPAVALVGGSAYVAVQLVDTAFWFASSETAGYADDTQVAKLILLYGWNSGFVYVPCLAGVVVAGTLSVFASRVLPRWLGWVGAVIAAGMVVSVFADAVGASVVPAYLWLVLASLALAFGKTERAPAPTVDGLG